jgi:hypothetical protein
VSEREREREEERKRGREGEGDSDSFVRPQKLGVSAPGGASESVQIAYEALLNAVSKKGENLSSLSLRPNSFTTERERERERVKERERERERGGWNKFPK